MQLSILSWNQIKLKTHNIRYCRERSYLSYYSRKMKLQEIRARDLNYYSTCSYYNVIIKPNTKICKISFSFGSSVNVVRPNWNIINNAKRRAFHCNCLEHVYKKIVNLRFIRGSFLFHEHTDNREDKMYNEYPHKQPVSVLGGFANETRTTHHVTSIHVTSSIKLSGIPAFQLYFFTTEFLIRTILISHTRARSTKHPRLVSHSIETFNYLFTFHVQTRQERCSSNNYSKTIFWNDKLTR